MRNSNFISVVAVVCGILIVGAAVGYFAIRPGSGSGDSVSNKGSANVTSEPVPARTVPNTAPGSRSGGSDLTAKTRTKRPRHPAGNSADGTNALASVPPDLITNWEDKLDELLTADGEDSDKAKKMLEMFPHLPQDGQVEVAQHLSNLISDADYAPLGQFLTNSAMPEDVLDVLMGDALNRPNSVKLPILLEIAQNTQHPKAEEAKDMMELFLEEDYGTDWALWKTKMDAWLKENPD
jgi:hypothetical protein